MKKYVFDKQLKIRVKPIFCKWLFPFANALIRILPKRLDKRKVTYQKGRAAGSRFHILTPKEATKKPLPCVFYIHGGGFAYCQSPHQYRLEQAYCTGAKCMIFSVDYPLSPKATYPKAVDVLFDAYLYMLNYAEKLGVDATKIVVAGDSAGGSLALDLIAMISKYELSAPKGLMAIYPVVDAAQNTESMRKFYDTPLWNSRCNAKMWKWYLKGKPYQSPLSRPEEFRTKYLFVETEEYDCLRDEGAALFDVLSPHTEYAQLRQNKHTFHGFDVNFGAETTQKAVAERVDFLTRCFSAD